MSTSKQVDATDEVIANAKHASENEHNMTLLQGIRLYPKAVAWSLLISTCIAMEGKFSKNIVAAAPSSSGINNAV